MSIERKAEVYATNRPSEGDKKLYEELRGKALVTLLVDEAVLLQVATGMPVILGIPERQLTRNRRPSDHGLPPTSDPS